MKTTPLLALSLTLVPTTALAQRSNFRVQSSAPEVRTVRTDTPIDAGRAIGGISVDDQGRFYLATFRKKIYRVEIDGSVTLLTNSFTQASGNSIDNGGELLQSEYKGNELYRVHEDGSRTLITDVGLSGPVGVVMDRNDDIYVVNFLGDTISRITPNGTTLQFSADPLLNGPNGIIIDDTGSMYVANFRDNLLLRIHATGSASVVAAIGPLSTRNNAHLAACGGKLYVSSIFNHRIFEVTPSGQVSVLAGTGSPGTRDGFAPHQATLYHPNGMTSGSGGKVLYTNNYIGVMGSPGSTMTVRAIHLR